MKMPIGRKAYAVPMLAFALSLTGGCNKSLPNDGANAKLVRFQNLHGVRYIEIFIFGGDPLKGNVQANVYNTTGISGLDFKSDKDSAPQAWIDGLDLEAIKKQYDAYKVTINGPKQWMLDWIDIFGGRERDFNGKKIPWGAELNLSLEQLLTLGKEGYKPMTIARKSKFGYNKGTLAFLIDDAEGNTWIMKGFEIGKNPRWSYEQFAVDPASHYQKLPAGWKYRTKVLDQDLVLIPETGIATIMPDEFFNVYDKTGAGYSNYKP